MMLDHLPIELLQTVVAPVATAANSNAPPQAFSPTLLMYLVLGVGILIYGILRLGEFAIKKLREKGKVWIGWADGDVRAVKWELAKRVGNTIETKVSGNPAIFPLEGEAALMVGGKQGWLLNPRNGHNLRIPTDAQITERLQKMGDKDAKLLDFNPFTLWWHMKHNMAQAAMRENEENEDWRVRIAPLMLIGLLIIMGMLGFLIYNFGKVISAAAAAAGHPAGH